MSFEAFPQYPPVDVELVDRIVCKLKSQGIFDQFRKDCLADVDTKPAYQNLQQRVNGTVATFLATQTWQQDLNKTQLRESLRRHVQQGYLEVGVDRIVDQVVNPKVFTVFMPKVEDIVYDCLGLEKPKHPPQCNNSLTGRKITLIDLLPKDLDPVSPDSDNLSFDDDEETKDETNNNESLSKLDTSHDSQVSGISDLSSHMGDSFKENNIDSNTAKSASSVKENSSEFHFENFENLSEKIKQAEIGHNQATSSDADMEDIIQSNTELDVELNNIHKSNKEDISMEIDSVSNSTFEDTKIFINKIVKEDTCSRTISEDSMSCSSFSAKKEKNKSLLTENCVNSQDKSEATSPCKESSSDKEVKLPATVEDMKLEEHFIEQKESKKSEELKEKKPRDSSSSSSKTSKSSSDKHRSSESKHRLIGDKKDDVKQNKEKTLKEDKEKVGRDEKDKSSRHRDDRHYSSKDKHREKEKSKEKDGEKKKDMSEKDRKEEKDKSKDKDRNEKEKTKHDKENHKHDRERSKQDKEKEKYDKDRHEKIKRDKEKLEKEKRDKDKYENREKEREREKDRSKEKDKGKSDKEKDNKIEKDKENTKPIEDKYKEEKKKETRKYDKSASTSKKDDNYKEAKDKSRRSDENNKDKNLNNKVGKSEDEKRERKRKAERCNDEIKLKEARRSWDRDSSGGNSKGHGSHKPSSSECKVSTSSGSAKEKRTGESSNQQKTSERKLEPVCEAEEPSDVDKILMKINSSIEESQNVQSKDEQAVKKPKIARNIFEIRKIMQARKNLARQMRHDKKKKESSDSVQEVDVIDSPSTTQPTLQDKTKIREENKENIKTGQLDKMKSPKVCHAKGKFIGFLESDIEKSRNSLQNFQSWFYSYCRNIGLNVIPTDSVESIDFSKLSNFNEVLLDDNLNKLKPRSVSLERRKTYPDDKQVSKAVENIMSGKNGCYVLLQDCTEVVEAMRNAAAHKQTLKQADGLTKNSAIGKLMPSKLQTNQLSSLGNVSKSIATEPNPLMEDDSSPKNATNSSANTTSAVRTWPQVQDCVVELDPTIICNTSQQQLMRQQETPVKKITGGATGKPTVEKQDKPDEEPSSPGIAISVALNPFLNDSVLKTTEIPPSVSLTEAMLDNLMRESSMTVEDESFQDSDDSDNEYITHVRDSVRKLEVNQELFNEKEMKRHITPDDNNTSTLYSSDDTMMVMSDCESFELPKKKAIDGVIHTPSCHTLEKGSPPEGCEDKSLKRRNQKLCRSASQRYDSTDLYKPRPVLPQNAKRVRALRSASSEELSMREQCEISPIKKRAR